MKKTLIILCILINTNIYGQIETAAAALLTTLGVIFSVEELEEKLELEATQWILENKPNIKVFEVKVLGKGLRNIVDLQKSSYMAFTVKEFLIKDLPDEKYNIYTKTNKNSVLIMYAFRGFINQYGVTMKEVYSELIDKEMWLDRMENLVNDITNTNKNVREVISKGRIGHRGVSSSLERNVSENPKKNEINFYKINSDTHIVSDYSEEFLFVYTGYLYGNRKTLGIFNKKTKRLIEMKEKTIRDIHKFLLE